MSSVQGTLSGYESISKYRLYMDLSYDDKEFSSGLINPVSYSDLVRYEKINNKLIKENNDTYKYLSRGNYDFLKFIDKYNLVEYMNGDYTLFIPLDGVDKLFDLVENEGVSPIDIFNYHKLNYVLLPIQIIDKTLRLQTKLKGQYITCNNLNIVREYGGMVDKNPNKILQSIQTDNGFIYFIQRVLIPYKI